VEKIHNGDALAEAELVRRFYSKIRQTARFKLGFNNSDWEDVAQECYLRVSRLLREGRFNSEKGKLSSFISGVIHKVVQEYRRPQKGRFMLPLFSDPERIPKDLKDALASLNQQMKLEYEENVVILNQCLKILAEHHYAVLKLRYYQKLPMRKIGEKINKTEQQVIDLKRFALKKMRDCFEKHFS